MLRLIYKRKFTVPSSRCIVLLSPDVDEICSSALIIYSVEIVKFIEEVFLSLIASCPRRLDVTNFNFYCQGLSRSCNLLLG